MYIIYQLHSTGTCSSFDMFAQIFIGVILWINNTFEMGTNFSSLNCSKNKKRKKGKKVWLLWFTYVIYCLRDNRTVHFSVCLLFPGCTWGLFLKTLSPAFIVFLLIFWKDLYIIIHASSNNIQAMKLEHIFSW